MLLQACNIIAGIILAAPGLKSTGQRELWEKIESAAAPWQATFGLITLALGSIGLLVRLGILPAFLPDLGASFPQSLPAIIIGALLALPKLERFPAIAGAVKKLLPQSLPIGLIGVAAGLGSLLFGCFITVFCRVPF